MKLSDLTQGRDNNFNLIRIVAAFAVLITHSFALAIGTSDAEPFRESLGMTLGSIAVDVFFITSGFLVAASLLTRQSAIEFIWARVLRIFPALLIMLLITVFVVGVFYTSLPLSSYFSYPKTYYYFFKCATLITGVAYNLPGAFEENPIKYAVNGSLWTMPYEIGMYTILAVFWIVFRITEKNRLKAFELTIVASVVVAAILVISHYFHLATEGEFVRLFFMFFSGAAFYVLRKRVTLSRWIFLIFVGAQILSAMANKQTFFVVYVLTIAYILFYIAYVPAGFIRKYNQLGDYSYGVYIYAFPVHHFLPSLADSTGAVHCVSSLCSMVFSSLSQRSTSCSACPLPYLRTGSGL